MTLEAPREHARVPSPTDRPRLTAPRTRLRRWTAVALAASFLLSALLAFAIVPAPSSGGSAFLAPATSAQYNVTFTEKGLPIGTNWTAILAGTHHHSTTNQISVPQGNGTYNWSILALPGWAPNNGSGTLKVAGFPVFINVTFLRAWNVTIAETGLPAATAWTIQLNGTNRTTTSATLGYILSNGTYVFNVRTPLAGATGVQYVAAVGTYTIVVKGASINRTDAFTTQFFLTTAASPTPGGTVTPASAWFVNQTHVLLGETTNAGYRFVGWTGTGPGNYTGSSAAPTVTMGAPISEVADFAPLYNVTFTESGLVTGSSWSVTLGGTPLSSTTSTIVFAEPNGSYPFSVTGPSGYFASPSSGTVTVAGAPVARAIAWSQSTFGVTFVETGLPAGTFWSVTLSGAANSSTTSGVGFLEPNGTYSFVVGSVNGYSTSTPSGTVTVNGHAQQVNIAWSRVMYTVTFAESGLAAGTSWSVTLNGTTQSGPNSTHVFSLGNGKYTFTVAPLSGYLVAPAGGSVIVNGTNQTLPVVWSRLYTLSVAETGLPTGTNWSATIAGTLVSGDTPVLSVSLPDGSYFVNLTNFPGYRASAYHIPVQIAGANVTVSVTWQVTTYALTFAETGLPNGTAWSVTVGGSLLSTTGTTIVFTEANGSLPFSVSAPSGYSASPKSGNATIAGSAVTEAISFASTGSGSTIAGLPALEFYVLLGAIALVVIGALAAIVVRGRRAKPKPKE